jgi:hypothetical protein
MPVGCVDQLELDVRRPSPPVGVGDDLLRELGRGPLGERDGEMNPFRTPVLGGEDRNGERVIDDRLECFGDRAVGPAPR